MKFLSIDLYFPTIHFSTFQFYFHSFHSCTTTIPTTDSDNWLHPFPIHLLNDKNRKIKRMSWRWRPFSFIYFLLFFILFTHNQILSCSDHFIFFHCNWHGLKRMKRGSSLFIIRPLSFRLKSAFPFLFDPFFLILYSISTCVCNRPKATDERRRGVFRRDNRWTIFWGRDEDCVHEDDVIGATSSCRIFYFSTLYFGESFTNKDTRFLFF